LPLLLSTAEAAEKTKPLGLTINGGLIYSHHHTLNTTPNKYQKHHPHPHHHHTQNIAKHLNHQPPHHHNPTPPLQNPHHLNQNH
ncbi:hypothetical protein RA269_28495, partial [Pseudomonas syringae pv. tagetis]|uniref:hypothetical protein n=1 Tax=Pseudomonas syringae group genomosp. 7 TaxID=251699 RepID=UPI00376FE4A1